MDLTNEVYRNWIRAQRPPFEWFLGLEPDQQEQLAIIGEDYQADVCVAIGFALQDPELAAAGLDADTNPESEEILARRVAAEAVQKLLGDRQPPRSNGGLSMGGVTQRRAQADQARQKAKDRGRRLLGREPDE